MFILRIQDTLEFARKLKAEIGSIKKEAFALLTEQQMLLLEVLFYLLQISQQCCITKNASRRTELRNKDLGTNYP